jgi:hypothetical protein
VLLVTQLVALCALLSAHDARLIDTALIALEKVLSKEHTASISTFSSSTSSCRGSWDASDRNPYALLVAETGGLDQVRLIQYEAHSSSSDIVYQ